MSSALTWMLVKDNSCFLKKQRHSGGALFSTEPFNVDNRNSYKSSGLANGNAIDVSIEGGLKSKDGKVTVALNSFKSKKMNSAIKSATSNYRRDLQAKAMARFSALKKATHVKKGSRAKKVKRVRTVSKFSRK